MDAPYTATPFLLYNWLQDSAIQKLVLDVRAPEQFDIGYVKTAINLTIPDNISEDQELNLSELDEKLTPKNRAFKSRGLIFTHLVVYDGNGESQHARKLVEALIKESKARNVKLLQGGYQTFAVHHPYLCSTSLKKAAGGAYPSAIVDDFLYLGSHENAKNRQQLKDLGISHIVNMAGELENEFPNDFKYLSFRLDDTVSSNISEHFEKVLQFIEEARASSSKVLVHCAMGISRSSSVVIAYLMYTKDMSYEEAHKFVRSMRSCIKPNPGFMSQLVAFEKQLLTAAHQANQLLAQTQPQIMEAMRTTPPQPIQPLVAQPLVAQPLVAQPLVAQPLVAQPLVPPEISQLEAGIAQMEISPQAGAAQAGQAGVAQAGAPHPIIPPPVIPLPPASFATTTPAPSQPLEHILSRSR